MWAQYEDRIAAALAAESGDSPSPATRLQAIRLIAILRTLASPELRAAITSLPPDKSLAYVCDWLLAAGRACN